MTVLFFGSLTRLRSRILLSVDGCLADETIESRPQSNPLRAARL